MPSCNIYVFFSVSGVVHFPIWAGAHDCRDTMAAAPSFLATLLAVAAAPAPPLTATTLQVDDGTSLIHRQQQKQPSTTAESPRPNDIRLVRYRDRTRTALLRRVPALVSRLPVQD